MIRWWFFSESASKNGWGILFFFKSKNLRKATKECIFLCSQIQCFCQTVLRWIMFLIIQCTLLDLLFPELQFLLSLKIYCSLFFYLDFSGSYLFFWLDCQKVFIQNTIKNAFVFISEMKTGGLCLNYACHVTFIYWTIYCFTLLFCFFLFAIHRSNSVSTVHFSLALCIDLFIYGSLCWCL